MPESVVKRGLGLPALTIDRVSHCSASSRHLVGGGATDLERAGGLVSRAPESRLSDDERDQVAARLRAAVGEGRLTPEEFEQRLSAVMAARTYGEADPYPPSGRGGGPRRLLRLDDARGAARRDRGRR
ncbi:DUF1707 domain-containing protein [Nonomuraea angiospora]|uniref:DUF1707 SHOCT-like domain-containing protein n=1 Tax=Nonomuraea angiospora TaxID=46172 RepID=UPI00331D12B9